MLSTSQSKDSVSSIISEIKSILIEMKENMATKADIAAININLASMNKNIATKADIEKVGENIESLKFWIVGSVYGGMVTLALLLILYFEIFVKN